MGLSVVHGVIRRAWGYSRCVRRCALITLGGSRYRRALCLTDARCLHPSSLCLNARRSHCWHRLSCAMPAVYRCLSCDAPSSLSLPWAAALHHCALSIRTSGASHRRPLSFARPALIGAGRCVSLASALVSRVWLSAPGIALYRWTRCAASHPALVCNVLSVNRRHLTFGRAAVCRPLRSHAAVQLPGLYPCTAIFGPRLHPA
jgi:hypothetical protein